MGASSVVLLPHAPSSVAVARRRLSSDLLAHGVRAGVVDDANVIISELLSNALRHARPLASGQIRVSWVRNGDEVEVAVSDGGAMTEPRRSRPTLSSLGGRGLGIVEALARCWGVRHEEECTTVWAVLSAPRTASTTSAAAAPGMARAAVLAEDAEVMEPASSRLNSPSFRLS
ncbi:Anti-sigma regulatory factor (Ser/Thr protein kinase) [Thermomonospora echinospora]|uniref:Anti-sigma regulatory factor (Ser/Thr protein kinase) n=1 Tax=Thermomonospora echinospora TaxID=1992 RepID=A0A1H6CTY2_9ACTN|nr:ATP-binding protein [Thermomonospora echinospora]SEG76412.1 Anti-sigma regulatory factor (Ser/Thr protein kinase) [Thermomonospora echinospora]